MQESASQLIDIVLPLDDSENESVWKAEVASKLGIPVSQVSEVRLRKHSIDARQRLVKVQLRLEVALDDGWIVDELPKAEYPAVPSDAPPVIIVGCGPAGMFAALRCIELGAKPVILERGKDASSRRFDLAPILRHGTVIEDSNYCFGEGGAGTFSDGKLYTRAKKRGPVADVYRTLVAHGAPERILVDAHPHIGSNLLPNVVKAMRRSVLNAGGEVHFQTRVTGLLLSDGRINGVVAGEREFLGDAVILATGHSARDIYHLLHRHQVMLEPKPFAVGVRIEHPQALIDEIQYHLRPGESRHRLLPAASYRVATKIGNRGVHSFCMCPGGFIVPCATENDEVVVNGMSLSKRDSPFANSGLVVTVEPEDVQVFEREHGVLAGIAFQKALEHAAKQAGGGGQAAPGQRVTDFIAARTSSSLPKTSYHPGITPARLDELLPDWIVWRMKKGLALFGEEKCDYVSDAAVLVGFETRTSSPIRIPRDTTSLQHPAVRRLIPCGEGAGFAGGIVSAALDGLRCAAAAVACARSR